MKKDILGITSVREIKSSSKRFISLLVMSMLGVLVFVGLKASPKDMTKSLDVYYDNNNVYDIKLISTLGFTDNEVEYLKKLNLTSDVYGSYSKDVVLKVEEKESVARIIGINDKINKVELKDGKLPSKDNEIVVEEALLSHENLKIGDSIEILDKETFKNTNLKIVGVVKSSLFISSVTVTPNRGNTNLGSGKVNYYIYTTNNNFNLDYYTEVYVYVKGAKKEETNSKKYNKLIENSLKEINKKKKFIEESRYNSIYNEYYNKIEEKRLEGEKQLDDAKKELDSASLKLVSGKIELDNAKKRLDSAKEELSANKEKLDSANKLLIDNKEKLDNAKKVIDESTNKIDEELNKYGLTIKDIKDLRKFLKDQNISEEEIFNNISKVQSYYDNLSDLSKNIIIEVVTSDLVKNIINSDKLLDVVKNIINDEELYNSIKENINDNSRLDEILQEFNLNDSEKQKIKELINNNKELNNFKEFINDEDKTNTIKRLINDDDLITKIRLLLNSNLTKDKLPNILSLDIEYIKELFDSLDKLSIGSSEYNEGIIKYQEGLNEYNSSYELYNSYYNEYEKGLNEYNSGLELYNKNLNLYNSSIEEYYNSLNMFNIEIDKAFNDLENSIPESTLYIYDRMDDSDYSGFISDGESVSNLAKVFPTIFFIVAILVSLVSMSRMVEDDRIEIGTLKSLGFSDKHIRRKYIMYSGIATILGGIIGSILGFYTLPYFIWNIYKILFDVPIFVYKYDFSNIIFGILIATICICGTTLLTIKKVVKEKPSELMRPKAPSNGKRVLLERISFIWNNISFSNKVTTRNLFRYKKRVIMTLVGIIGCTSLMLAGFGIRDSIVDIASIQFNKIFYFDDMAYIINEPSKEELDKIFNDKHITSRLDTRMIVSDEVGEYGINIFVPDNEEDIKNVLILRNKKTKEEIKLENNKVVISDKLAELKGKKIGDEITIKDSFGKPHTFEISNICENYVGHYVFMNKKTYEKEIGKYSTNVVYYNIDNNDYDEKLSEYILKDDNVMSIVSVSSTMDTVDNMLKSLDSVVFILIILSGALSLVVLYNLSYINISERKREIATLKVLGFTDKEVDNYIIKETIILTLIGILFGLILGIALTNVIINTVEVEMVRFLHHINISSFILTSILIMSFTILVSLIIHIYLKKIDMIESLKSIE